MVEKNRHRNGECKRSGASGQDRQQGGESWISNEDAVQVEVWYDFFFLSRRKHVGIGASSASKAKVSLLTRGLGVAMVARQTQAEFAPDSMSPIDASDDVYQA